MSTQPLNPNDAERLQSVQNRIAIIRAALEDPSLVTELTIDGVSERLNRRELREELRELEAEEAILTGRSARIFGIRMQ